MAVCCCFTLILALYDLDCSLNFLSMCKADKTKIRHGFQEMGISDAFFNFQFCNFFHSLISSVCRELIGLWLYYQSNSIYAHNTENKLYSLFSECHSNKH